MPLIGFPALSLPATFAQEERVLGLPADIAVVIFDLDGVIYRGEQVLPGALAAVAWVRERGWDTYFLTNNSTQTRRQYVRRLRTLGIKTDAEHIMTSAYATALCACEEGWAEQRVMVLGERGIYHELKAAGVNVFWAKEGGPADVVVVGMDRHCTYARLEAAHRAILGGARFVASNRDNTYPVEDGTIPGAGIVVAGLEASTGVRARLIGKPNTYPVEKLLQAAGVPPGRAVIVGDRADTDIATGLRVGLWTVLVLTGITTAEEARALPPDRRPHRVIETLEELPGVLARS